MRKIQRNATLEDMISERIALEIRINVLENTPPGMADYDVGKSLALLAARNELQGTVAKIAEQRKAR